MTQEEAKRFLDYDAESGIFTWKSKPSHRVNIGAIAGSINPTDGYWHIQFRRKKYKRSRLAWLYMTGRWPSDEIDHINRDCLDDSFGNLREASRTQNNANRRVMKSSRTQIKGVRVDGRYIVARVTIGGKRIKRGFKTLEAARLFYEAESSRIYGDFARSNGGKNASV